MVALPAEMFFWQSIEAIAALDIQQPVDLTPTFLPASILAWTSQKRI
ncbi:MAG: hypothetical protein IAE79_23210 [Anaerolinea sp.]|nr:hypothetical protein [Anaerolinea sp.]